mmetsp:Transcript_180223/g.438495  ORF Transcript_180223/g.438495 Transcript_180223/m.438495 type:complete len:251 (-) Transcript_180223:43-795(-)
MARQYDSQTTTFSPEGRLFQVEYAIEAINNAASAVGLLCDEGVVIATEKVVVSKLLAVPKKSEKIYKVDEHVMTAIAGLTADANILLNYARVIAQRYRFRFRSAQPVEQLVQEICDQKHVYTQHGSLRPYGVSFLFAGWDKHHGFQLYHSDPSGNYGGWKAAAIGKNFQGAQSTLKSEYKDGMDLDETLKLAVKTLTKTMDTTAPSSEKVELATLSLGPDGSIVQRQLTPAEVDAMIKQVEEEDASAGDV